MPAVFRIVLIYCILIALFSPSNVCALRLWDADAVVTMRDGLPCFSYPQDEEIQKRPYSFDYLSVSKPGPIGGVMWEMQISNPEGRGLLEPNSQGTCIKYGGPHPGTKDIKHAETLLMDMPYEVRIAVSARTDKAFYERRYTSYFCLTQDEKGNKAIVDVDKNTKDGVVIWKCLKPGEKPKKGLWESLFGN